jgi:polyisoprenoid-binding protein YceI
MKQQALRFRIPLLCKLLLLLITVAAAAAAQSTTFRFDAQQTLVKYTLGDVLHTVHGTFQLKSGTLHLDPAAGKLTGEIVVDATSGASGSAMRDRKMHREVLESARFSEITFRPDRVDGTVLLQGKSSVQVHGIFSIHGTDHEFTAPAVVEISPDHWTANVHFSVPYVKWGMKNPSTLFLRVSESVDIDMSVAGSIVQQLGYN